MIRSVVLSACVLGAGCLFARPAHAQATIPDSAAHTEKAVLLKGDKVSVRFSGSVVELLASLMEQAKQPYILGAGSKDPVNVEAANLELDEMLTLVCEAANPRLQYTRRSGVYLFTAAPPRQEQPAPAPQVTVNNNLPQQDGLAASLAVTGPNANDTLLELRLLSLQAERKSLTFDFKEDFPKLKRVTGEIRAVQQLIALRRAQKSRKPRMGSAGPERRKQVRTAQRG